MTHKVHTICIGATFLCSVSDEKYTTHCLRIRTYKVKGRQVKCQLCGDMELTSCLQLYLVAMSL